MLAVEEAPLLKSGVLSKRGTGWLKRWNKRYWELRADGYLSYFSSAKSTAVRRGLVDVKHNLKRVLFGREAVQVSNASWPKQSEDTFLLLVTDDRVYCLMAEDGYECHDWVQSFGTFVKVKPSGNGMNCFNGNGGLKNNKNPAPGMESYDALTAGEGEWEDCDGPGEFEIVYDSPIRDTTLRHDNHMTINTSTAQKRVPASGKQPFVAANGQGDYEDEYEEYEVDQNPKKKSKKTKKLPRLPAGKKRGSLQRRASKGKKELPLLPHKPSQISLASNSQPEPIPRKPRTPAAFNRPSVQPPPQWRRTSRTSQSGDRMPERPPKAGGKDPRPAPRRRTTPPAQAERQPSADMYINNAKNGRRSGPPPPPPPARGRQASFSGSVSSGDVFLSQPKVIGKNKPQGKRAMLPAVRGKNKR